ncbi:MAG TPA: hypothetical protein VFT22_10275 [Kofleriaceae bacterium]|nr:hypothetical protein [Kofleriaceae bacterium]
MGRIFRDTPRVATGARQSELGEHLDAEDAIHVITSAAPVAVPARSPPAALVELVDQGGPGRDAGEQGRRPGTSSQTLSQYL